MRKHKLINDGATINITDNERISLTEENINLSDNFIWYDINPKSDTDINDLYKFLYDNYNDTGDKFGLHYTIELLQWYLSNPNYFTNLFLVVKYKEKIVGSVIGIPITMSIFDKIDTFIYISFLCINKKLRSKSLCGIMTKKIIQRVYLNNLKYIYFASSLLLPAPIHYTIYYHRVLNIKKMVNIGFMSKPPEVSMKSFEQLYKTIDKLTLNLQKINENDIPKCTQQLNEFNKKYKIHQIYTEEEFKYNYLPRINTNDSYVYIKDNNILAFVSVVYLKSRIFNNNTYSDYDIAQICNYFYNDDNIFIEMISNILLLMKQKNIDCVYCLDQMDNNLFIDNLQFKKGTGKLYFYIWNKQIDTFTNKDISLITL